MITYLSLLLASLYWSRWEEPSGERRLGLRWFPFVGYTMSETWIRETGYFFTQGGLRRSEAGFTPRCAPLDAMMKQAIQPLCGARVDASSQ